LDERRLKDTPKATQQDWFRQVFDNNAVECGEKPAGTAARN